ncbi:MAG: hypothetical protein AAGF73_11295 [Actinomycetota bacterium]
MLLLPPLVVVILTHGRVVPMVAAIVGAVVGGWVFAANVVLLSGWELRITGLLALAAIVVVAAAPYARGLNEARSPIGAAAIAGVVSFIAALWWRPCVGDELGTILTEASRSLPSALPGMTAYMLGAMAPVVLVGLLLRAVEPSPRAMAWIAGPAALAGIGLTGLLALDRHSELVGTLTRWTL